MRSLPRILLVDSNEAGRRKLAERLQLQGFLVVECQDGAEGAARALEDPPAAVVADLSMPSISGVQLCRLLSSEAGTSHVPVLLRGSDGRRNRFWAEQAGAFSYVIKGRMGELVRALRRAIAHAGAAPLHGDDFFVMSSVEAVDVRERIAAHLDAALFDSVIAAEVRRLGHSESFDRLFDLLSQFVSGVTSYRWMALSRTFPQRLGLHAHSECRASSLSEALKVLELKDDVPCSIVEDDDAAEDPEGPSPVCEPILFGDQVIGALAIALQPPVHYSDPALIRTITRELGGALRMATLVEESRWMATIDPLTGLLNRRAFVDRTSRELRRAHNARAALSVIMLDVDHFKQINDRRGHASGDFVLSAIALILPEKVRPRDLVARWGGEEFVITLPETSLEQAASVAERIREALESAHIPDVHGEPVPVTASLGVAELLPKDSVDSLVDRADRAMYMAKTTGRNRVVSASREPSIPSPPVRSESVS